ncbi:MAG: hypothetical protein EOP56_12210 [Sphingobacteriales bacterium]|nr:MAG: hypothetical protein EOP56_12210 [Sphingobacteriales bacterium]
MSAENKAFWKQYDLLIASLESNGFTDIQQEVAAAKLLVNGYPNGWQQLLDELKRIELTHRDRFIQEQRIIFFYLISQLKNSLEPGRY